MKIYDLIIIGAGPAGITAGIYGKNFGLDCLIIGEKVGGLINAAYKVENYPGIFNVSGKELTKKFLAHQKYLKVAFKRERIEAVKKQGRLFKIFTKKNKYQSRALVLAFGTETKKLNIKNINKFEGRGKSKNKIVAVVGGANAAVMKAVMLAEEAEKVYLIYRQDKLRADALWRNKIKKLKNIEVIYKANVVRLEGEKKLKKIILDKDNKELSVDGFFIETGTVPNKLLIKDLDIRTDEQGYIKIDKTQATNIKGIFAAGDVTTGSNEFRQIITACSEAAIAVLGAFNYLKKK